MLTSPDHRFYRGHWSAGRLVSHTSFHGEETTWVFDLVVDEAGRLRAVTRTRAGRGASPSLARVLDRAIIQPRVGRPHLPVRVKVNSTNLARELQDLSVDLATSIAPTPELELLRPALEAMLIPQDGQWKWFDDECDRHALDVLCEQILDLGATFAWYTMSGQEAIRVESQEGREVLHIRLEAREGLDQRLRLALHVARDEATLEAWRKGRVGDTEIVIREILRDELSEEAFGERVELERPESWVYPRVTVGVGGRAPTRDEWQIAARALMSFNALHDPLEGDESGIQTRTLDNGDEVVIEVLDPEFDLFPENDGAIEGALGSPEDREDMAFVEAYMHGAFEMKAVGRVQLFA